MQPRLAARAAAILTVSQFSANRLAFHGVTKREVLVTPNGTDHFTALAAQPDILNRLGPSRDPYVVGFSSRQAHKNTALLLKLFEKPRPDRLRLVLVGADPPQDGAAVGRDVILLGKVADGELRALYEGAVCLLFPSQTEGFGLPVGEAMSCGCPVIAADIPVMQEFWGRAAVLLPCDNLRAWDAALSELASNEDKRNQMSAAGREVAANLTWDKSAAKIRVIAERSAASGGET
jgi:glycosyltransferase involved in cell wall biosynthesis